MAGGGPAGSACAIAAARSGARVLLLEKERLPRHKVCGEFVSPESLRLLASILEGDRFAGHPQIDAARVFLDHRVITIPLKQAASSISRFELDQALLFSARRAGVRAEEGASVLRVDQGDVAAGGAFKVQSTGAAFSARAVVDATGRWSQLTRHSASAADARWIGLKAHFREAGPPRSVDLYFFSGGYCGVQRVGDDTVNAAAMVRPAVARSLEEVFAAHPALWRRSRDWEPLFPAVTTAPLYFKDVETAEGYMLRAGDAAGFIDPFAGDGISLALHSGTLAAESLAGVFRNQGSLVEAALRYREAYRRRFAPAFRNAARLRRLLDAPAWFRSSLLGLVQTRPIAALIVRGTRARIS